MRYRGSGISFDQKPIFGGILIFWSPHFLHNKSKFWVGDNYYAWPPHTIFPSVLFRFVTGIPRNPTSGCMDTSGARIVPQFIREQYESFAVRWLSLPKRHFDPSLNIDVYRGCEQCSQPIHLSCHSLPSNLKHNGLCAYPSDSSSCPNPFFVPSLLQQSILFDQFYLACDLRHWLI
jgi:hypothetical protein